MSHSALGRVEEIASLRNRVFEWVNKCWARHIESKRAVIEYSRSVKTVIKYSRTVKTVVEVQQKLRRCDQIQWKSDENGIVRVIEVNGIFDRVIEDSGRVSMYRKQWECYSGSCCEWWIDVLLFSHLCECWRYNATSMEWIVQAWWTLLATVRDVCSYICWTMWCNLLLAECTDTDVNCTVIKVLAGLL